MNVSQKAKDVFLSGKLIGLPTETVYGLAAPFDDLELVKKIFAVKKRPAFDPLIVHVSSTEMAKRLVVEFPKEAEALAKKYWPGPLTIVLPKKQIVSDLVTAGQSTVALRSPNHPVALEIIRGLDKPLVAPSANPYQKLSPVSAKQVEENFKDSDVFVFDGGECNVGIESTIVGIDVSAKRFSVLRKGVISSSDVGSCLLGFSESLKEDYLPSEFHVPGADSEHYRPELPLIVDRLNTALATVRSKFNIVSSAKIIEVPLSSDPFLAARSLYKELYHAGKHPGAYILVRVPRYSSAETMVWEAVLDRLKRAATHSID